MRTCGLFLTLSIRISSPLLGSRVAATYILEFIYSSSAPAHPASRRAAFPAVAPSSAVVVWVQI
jgi:hypothetical protein